MLRMVLGAQLFDRLGVPYDIAGDGVQALDLLAASEAEGRPYDLVVMDNQVQ